MIVSFLRRGHKVCMDECQGVNILDNRNIVEFIEFLYEWMYHKLNI